MCDPPGVETLNRSDRLAVVSKLGVVVILDPPAPPAPRPSPRGQGDGRRHHDSGRKLVGRGDHDGIGAKDRQLISEEAISVNRTADESEAGLRARSPTLGMRGRLDRRVVARPVGQLAAEQIECLA